MAQVAITTPDERHDALRAALAELLALDEPRKRIAAMLTGLDIHYDLGEIGILSLPTARRACRRETASGGRYAG